MDETALIILSLLAGGGLLLLAFLLWLCGDMLRLTPDEAQASALGRWGCRALGWLVITAAQMVFTSSALVGTYLALFGRAEFIAQAPIALMMFVAACVALTATVRAAFRRLELPGRASVDAAAGAARLEWRELLATPPGLVLATLVLCAGGVAGFVVVELSLDGSGGGLTSAASSLFLSLILPGLLCLLLTFVGHVLVAAADMTRLPCTPAADDLRRLAWRTLCGLQYLFLIAGLLCWGTFGVLIFVAACCVALSMAAGSWRGNELSVLWTLAMSVRSGRSLASELQTQSLHAPLRSRPALRDAARLLSEGVPLEDVLRQKALVARRVWLQTYAGLDAGNLQSALRSAAARETARLAAPGSAPLSPAYFGVVVGVLIAVISFIMYYIIPKFKKIFEDFDVELPELTVLVIRMCEGVWGELALLFGLPAVVVLTGVGIGVEFYGWHGFFERFFSWLFPRLRLPDLLYGLKHGVEAERPLDKVLVAMAAAPLSTSIKTRLHRAASAIRDGEEAWVALHDAGWLNSAEAGLLQAAERAGNLPWALETLADAYTARLEHRLIVTLNFLNPAFVLTMGLVVAVFAIGFLMPLMKLINDLS